MNQTPIIVIAAVILIAGCSRLGIQGDGVLKTEDRPISEFSKLVVADGYEVEWSSGKPRLTLSADQNLLPLVGTVSSGNTLQIGSKEGLVPTKRIKIILTSATLADVRLTDAIRFKASQVSGQDLRLEGTDASEISVDGSVTNLDARLTGASKLNAKSLQTQNATLSLGDASAAEVTVTESLKATVKDAGSLTYSGNPKSVEQKVTDAGTIKNRP